MVTVLTTTAELLEKRSKENGPIGFVPTMGNLHQGHLSLLAKALEESAVVYFSIFVNPKQFGPHEDFNRYPRTLKDDLNLINQTIERFPNSQVIVYAPDKPEDVFPPSATQNVSVLGLKDVLEGEIRPGHFDGVATVVLRLFQLIRPTRAYFGLKDYQQWLVIKQMVNDLHLPINVIGMPIIREEEGLALSSRNQFLTSEQKTKALILSKSLKEIVSIIGGKKSNINLAQNRINELIKDSHWNYLEIRDAQSLSQDIYQSTRITLLGVYQLGSTRLLDNMQVDLE